MLPRFAGSASTPFLPIPNPIRSTQMPRCWRAAHDFQYDDFAMALEAIFARRALTPHDEIANPVVLIDGQKIVAIGRQDEISVPASANRLHKRDFTIVPGFIDVHIHGAAGHDVMEAKP